MRECDNEMGFCCVVVSVTSKQQQQRGLCSQICTPMRDLSCGKDCGKIVVRRQRESPFTTEIKLVTRKDAS